MIMNNETLTENIQLLLDIEAIKKLKARYCKYADSGENPNEFTHLFTENAVLDESDDGVFCGRDNILDMYKKIAPLFKLNQHLVLSPIIDIDGKKATGEWRLLQLCTTSHPEGDKAFWACGYYKERYVKVDSQWYFEHVEARVHFCCDYDDGWAKAPFVELLSAEAMSALGLT
jgi:hypothetical protein